jgi:RNA polymerase sigma-70 factor (ECF subfamily)
MEPLDADLIQRWQRGDPAAFEGIVRRWQHRIAGFLSRYVPEADLVSDLCQEVFLRVCQAGSRYRENGHFSTWIYRIALNVARDAARRRRPPALAIRSDTPAAMAPVEIACGQSELNGLVSQAIGELPENLRLVLVLRHYEEMSFEDMARLTDTPASTLKSRFTAALIRLRDRLQELGCGPEEIEE